MTQTATATVYKSGNVWNVDLQGTLTEGKKWLGWGSWNTKRDAVAHATDPNWYHITRIIVMSAAGKITQDIRK